uniref:Protein kinase domain-containing protein n=1 Tax=Aegilops tauschii subsp. strangulata TaxID=200361 RepID=A0A453AES4_AEGTS
SALSQVPSALALRQQISKHSMPRKVVKLHRLEDLFCETSTDKSMKLQVLQDITENFSVDTVIGSGGFAVVHKGKLEDGCVAVKKFHEVLEYKSFEREVDCLIRIKHQNIVRCIGYYAGEQKKMVMMDGKNLLVGVRHQLICFEYLHNGSLRRNLDGINHRHGVNGAGRAIIGGRNRPHVQDASIGIVADCQQQAPSLEMDIPPRFQVCQVCGAPECVLPRDQRRGLTSRPLRRCKLHRLPSVQAGEQLLWLERFRADVVA